ncbi:MAG: cobalamin-binding protein [Thermodesulfovibrionales bacterium]|nr:cobalamin-binding protein [Thermodesulfovibrionales bacterium]
MRSIVLFCFIFLFTYHIPFHTSVYAESPKRIISLAPSITEILFALGLGDRIVGVTNFCDYPEKAKKIQKIGGMSNPSLEGVISLKPDIVAMTTDGNPKEFEERLHSLQIRTYVFKAQRLSELPQAIREMGLALDAKDNANSLAIKIETAINRLNTKRQTADIINSQRKKIIFIIWPEPLIVAGPGTATDDVITLLGNENIASKAKTSYPKYSVEEIIHQAPDVIIIGKGHANMQGVSASLLKRLKSVPAVKNNKVFYVSESLYRLGPRVIEGIEEMADCFK